jgi:DNA-directed RNA polymerase subunit RPC12/RpoP
MGRSISNLTGGKRMRNFNKYCSVLEHEYARQKFLSEEDRALFKEQIRKEVRADDKALKRKYKGDLPATVDSHVLHKYIYQNNTFASSWALAFWVFCIDHKIPVDYAHVSGVDFIVNNNEFVKVGKVTTRREGVRYVEESESRMHVEYVYKRYGTHFFEDCKNKEPTHCAGKRLLVPITDISQAYAIQATKRKKHPKFSYNCTKCGHLVITGFKVLDNFKNLLCKECRKKASEVQSDASSSSS